MIKRVQLVNSTQQWRANGRYKVNTVVTHLGVDYQNTTGANSTPSLLTDWVVVSKELDVYSETETVVGTWIDGKPIYRTVFISYLDSNGLFVTNVPDIDSVINLHGIYSDIVNFNQYILPFVRLSYTDFVITASEFGDLFYTKDGGDIVCSCSQDGVPADGSVKIIFEYTKTTD